VLINLCKPPLFHEWLGFEARGGRARSAALVSGFRWNTSCYAVADAIAAFAGIEALAAPSQASMPAIHVHIREKGRAMTTSNDSLVFLTVRGTAAPKTLEATCKLHNETAGSPDSIAAARALGDLSHKVYAPVPGFSAKEGEILFFDWWKTAEGIGQFFSDPRVQGSKLFTELEPVVWMPARGAFGFDLPAPQSRSERYVGMVRGHPAQSPEHAIEVLNKVLSGKLSDARRRGQLSHQLFVKVPMPNAPATVEVLGVDHWYDAAGMNNFYAELKGFEKAFEAAPQTSLWQAATGGVWSEW
jgi:hypothetical protein